MKDTVKVVHEFIAFSDGENDVVMPVGHALDGEWVSGEFHFPITVGDKYQMCVAPHGTVQSGTNERSLTYGEKAVGVNFNPSGNQNVNDTKAGFARLIDEMHSLRTAVEDGEVKRMLSIAITEAQSSCMWAVKALTWRL